MPTTERNLTVNAEAIPVHVPEIYPPWEDFESPVCRTPRTCTTTEHDGGIVPSPLHSRQKETMSDFKMHAVEGL